ncbi:MAG: hypothetical protein HQL47_12040, partial [Gammaproteobacteria bacterium]|nr:hypothetical protein [Gammaproteobacteria bacterium]
MISFDLRSVLLVVAPVAMLLPLLAWYLLKSAGGRALHLWYGGSLLIGCAFLLLAMRDLLPDWATFHLAQGLYVIGAMMMVASL